MVSTNQTPIKQCVIVTCFALSLLQSGHAGAGTREVLHGLFCNAESQLDDVVAHLRRNLTLDAAIAIANNGKVECVLAKDIEFIVEGAAPTGEVNYLGIQFAKYEATLVGVMVGTNLRPVEPAVTTFFVGIELLISAVKQSHN